MPFVYPKPEISFGQWLGLCMKTLGRGRWKPPTRGQLAIGQVMEQPSLRFSQIRAFRGIGKSIDAAALITYLWRFVSKDLKCLVLSGGHDKAKDFSFQVLQLLNEMDELEHLRPRGHRGKRQESDAFDIEGCIPEQSRSLRSYGIFGNMTGGRADIIIPDDIEVPGNCETQHMREKLWKRFKEIINLLKPADESPSKVIVLGTPHTEESIYNRMIQEMDFRCFIWPALYPKPDQVAHSGHLLHPLIRLDLQDDPAIEGQPTDPERFDAIELAERRAKVGERDFRLNYMLDTRLADQDQYPLKINDLLVMDLDAEVGPEKALYSRASIVEDLSRDFCCGWDGDRFHAPLSLQEVRFKPYLHKLVFVDPSGRGKDETAYAVLGYVNGYLCVLDWGGFKEGFTDPTLDGLVKVATDFGCKGFVCEDNFGNGMFTKMLTVHIRNAKKDFGVEEFSVTGRKEARIIAELRPVLEQHRLIVNRPVIERDFLDGKKPGGQPYQALYQLSRMTDERGALRHDDRVDVLSLGARYFRDMMSVDSDLQVERDYQKELAAWAKKMTRPLEGLIRGDQDGQDSSPQELVRTKRKYGLSKYQGTLTRRSPRR